MGIIKATVRRIARSLGYSIRSTASPSNNIVGDDPLDDLASFVDATEPVIFDVGANVGQSIERFRSRFPGAVLHSFEPSPTTFVQLEEAGSSLEGVHLWNCALGSNPAQMAFLENSLSDMSSFLPLGESGWGEIARETTVEVTTIDAFCATHGVEYIDILKTDTQGFDYEVFKGAETTMRSGKIGLILCEMIFDDMYEDLPLFGDVFKFLESRGFRLVSFYGMQYSGRLASWTDALFVHESQAALRS